MNIKKFEKFDIFFNGTSYLWFLKICRVVRCFTRYHGYVIKIYDVIPFEVNLKSEFYELSELSNFYDISEINPPPPLTWRLDNNLCKTTIRLKPIYYYHIFWMDLLRKLINVLWSGGDDCLLNLSAQQCNNSKIRDKTMGLNCCGNLLNFKVNKIKILKLWHNMCNDN